MIFTIFEHIYEDDQGHDGQKKNGISTKFRPLALPDRVSLKKIFKKKCLGGPVGYGTKLGRTTKITRF